MMGPLEIAKLRKIAMDEHGQAVWVDQNDIPVESADPFWIFTGSQGCRHGPDGSLQIPPTAWFECLDWLSESGAAPCEATADTKRLAKDDSAPAFSHSLNVQSRMKLVG